MLLFDHFFRFVAPYDCLNCGREGSLLCAWCRPDVALPLPSRCYRCHKLTIDSAVCGTCRRRTVLKHVWMATQYDGAMKELIRRFKFERAKDATFVLADILDEAAPYYPAGTVISYVPTATSRVRQRGYDQAAELAKAFARKRGLLPVLPLLYREGQARQVGATRQERLEQLQSALRPRNQGRIQGASIILIDDIVTTGATLEAASKILKQAGAKSVNGLAIAQKQ